MIALRTPSLDSSRQVNDIRDARVDAFLNEMGEITLCEFPGDDPWTIDKFLSRTQVCIECNNSLKQLLRET